LVVQTVTIVTITPSVDEFVALLDSVSNRRHLSAAKAKQLKTLLPVLQLLHCLLSSSVFRPYILDDACMETIAKVLEHTVMVDSGETGIAPSGE